MHRFNRIIDRLLVGASLTPAGVLLAALLAGMLFFGLLYGIGLAAGVW